jgi:hypothetical protein
LELDQLKEDLKDRSSFPFLQTVLEKQSNAKTLYKKVSMNLINKAAFKNFMLQGGFVPEEECVKYKYLLDLFLINILDQSFQQTVIVPHLSNI